MVAGKVVANDSVFAIHGVTDFDTRRHLVASDFGISHHCTSRCDHEISRLEHYNENHSNPKHVCDSRHFGASQSQHEVNIRD